MKNYKEYTGKDAQNNNGNFTKQFKNYNLKLLKEGLTGIVAYSDKKLYNPYTQRIVNRSTFFTKNNDLRKKYKNNPLFSIVNQKVLYAKPYQEKLQSQIMKAEQTKTNKDITIDFTFLNNKLENLLNILKPTTTRYLLTTEDDSGNKKIYTLNAPTIQKLKQIIQQGEIITEEVELDSFRSVIYSWTLRRPFKLTILGDPPKKTQPTGAFFSYTHNLEKVDLSRYGVYTETQEKQDGSIYDVNCICHALQYMVLILHLLNT